MKSQNATVLWELLLQGGEARGYKRGVGMACLASLCFHGTSCCGTNDYGVTGVTGSARSALQCISQTAIEALHGMGHQLKLMLGRLMLQAMLLTLSTTHVVGNHTCLVLGRPPPYSRLSERTLYVAATAP